MGRRRVPTLPDGRHSVAISRSDVSVDGTPIRLARLRHHLLYVLAAGHPQTAGHQELIHKVWGYDIEVDAQGFVQTQVSRLRGNLGEVGLLDLVRTNRGVGYGISPSYSRIDAAFHSPVDRP